jgi:hypothetical protein
LSTAKRVLAAVFTAALLVGVASSPAVASDHLFNAIDASGRNPVPQNANPTTVPGEGNPFAGELGTPAVDLNEVDDRSGGHGHPQGG